MLRSPASGTGRARRGMVAAQLAVSMGVLMAVLAVVTDGGLMLVERRHAQATADAAALAAASDLYANWYPNNQGTDPNGTASASALFVAASNGYNNDGVSSTVQVNIPPHSGNFVNLPGYAEIVVTYYQPRGFSGIFASNPIAISARAVAQGQPKDGSQSMPGILLLQGNGQALSATGNGALDVSVPSGYSGSGGSIYVDSNGPNAVSMGSSTATAPSVYMAQSGSAPGGMASGSGSVDMGAAQLPDPLAYLPAPDPNNPPPGMNVVSLPNGITGTTVLSPNTIYILGGAGLSLSGQETLWGQNVMLYIANGSINLPGQASVNLTPMSTGPYMGVTLFQSRTNQSSDSIEGAGNLRLTGTIYAPSANLTVTSNTPADVFASQIIASSLTLSGNNTVNVDFGSAHNATPSIRAFGLVE